MVSNLRHVRHGEKPIEISIDQYRWDADPPCLAVFWDGKKHHQQLRGFIFFLNRSKLLCWLNTPHVWLQKTANQQTFRSFQNARFVLLGPTACATRDGFREVGTLVRPNGGQHSIARDIPGIPGARGRGKIP